MVSVFCTLFRKSLPNPRALNYFAIFPRSFITNFEAMGSVELLAIEMGQAGRDGFLRVGERGVQFWICKV